MQRELLTTPEGRSLEIVIVGTPQSNALILHHGALGSSENMAPIFREADARGLFAVGITRPGYAGSTRREGRRAHDYFTDTQVALDYFNIERFVSLGWSSGSPAAISDTQDQRNMGAITIAGDAPRDSADWNSYIEKYQPNNPATESSDWPPFDDFRTCTGVQLVTLFGSSLSAKDAEICLSSHSEELAFAIRHGIAPGDFGTLDDFESDAAPWGIDLAMVTERVAVFQGDEDRMCIPAHGHFLADKLGNSELILASGEGHISLMYNEASAIVDKAIEILSA